MSGLDSRSAVVNWSTNEIADSRVDYWAGNGPRRSATNGTLVTVHAIPLSGLARNTKYSFRVRSTNAAGSTASSAVYSFRTTRTDALSPPPEGTPTPTPAGTPLPSPAGTPTPAPGGATLKFSDEFDGTTLNASKWHTCSWWASTTCSIETQHELELYTKNNVSVANGALKLQARRETATAWNGRTYNYTSGMVSTGGREGEIAPGFTFTYGYMEARVKIPAGQGLWPAFWALPNDHSWPPEIDVMEIIGSRPNEQNMSYHYLDSSGTHQSKTGLFTGPNFSADWHTFGVDWQPNAIVWYVDGIERYRFTDAAVITSKPSYVLLNLAVGGDWPGSPDASTAFPSDYLVDYVRVWDRFGQ